MKKELLIKDPVLVNHPLANRMSIQDSSSHNCVQGISSEVAFFWGLKFQTIVLEEFAEYTDGADGDTRIYSYVPNELIESFLNEYRVVKGIGK
jgi:hypothetical protein